MLTVEQARLCVTGFDHNRPANFPGLGDFIGWARGIERAPNGDLLLVHSAGYWHVSFATPDYIAKKREKSGKQKVGRSIMMLLPGDGR